MVETRNRRENRRFEREPNVEHRKDEGWKRCFVLGGHLISDQLDEPEQGSQVVNHDGTYHGFGGLFACGESFIGFQVGSNTKHNLKIDRCTPELGPRWCPDVQICSEKRIDLFSKDAASGMPQRGALGGRGYLQSGGLVAAPNWPRVGFLLTSEPKGRRRCF